MSVVLADQQAAHDAYTAAVTSGDYPSDPKVPYASLFESESGVIANILLRPIGGVALISSTHGSVRSNHYHSTDWHYLYVLSGLVLYFYKPIGGEKIFGPVPFLSGSTFFTPPRVVHAVVSVGETELLSLSRMARTHEEHEADVVRVEIVSKEMAKRFADEYGSGRNVLPGIGRP